MNSQLKVKFCENFQYFPMGHFSEKKNNDMEDVKRKLILHDNITKNH